MEDIKCKLSIETFYVSYNMFALSQNVMKNRGQKHLFLLHAFIVRKPKKKKNSKDCFLWSCRYSSLTRRVIAGLSPPWRFFLRVPLKVSFVGPDVLCRYLFSLWTGQQKSSRHNDGKAEPHWHCCWALQKMALCLMWFSAGVGAGGLHRLWEGGY